MIPIIIICTFFFFFLFIFVTIGFVLYGKKRTINKRLEKFFPQIGVTENKKEEEEHLISYFKSLSRYMPSAFLNKKMEKKLMLAGFNMSIKEFSMFRMCLTFLAFMLTLTLFNLWGALAFVLITWTVMPNLYLNYRFKRRLARSVPQLSEALGIMSNAMRAGFSFIQAMQMVAKDMPDPLGTEFDITIKEINLGISYEKAFSGLIDRLPNKDLEIAISSLLIQRTSGGNLSSLLEVIRDTINNRIKVKEEAKTLTSQSRLSVWVISIFPFILIGFMLLIQPDYFAPLFSSLIGWMMVGSGVCLFVLGWLMIHRILQIEV